VYCAVCGGLSIRRNAAAPTNAVHLSSDNLKTSFLSHFFISDLQVFCDGSSDALQLVERNFIMNNPDFCTANSI